MNAGRSAALTALLLASSLALAACNSSEGGSSLSPRGGETLAVSLDLQSQARVGETIPLKLIVRNVSDRPVELALGGQEADGFALSHDFVATLPGGTEVWRWRHGGVAQSILSFKALEPGEELVLMGEWDQRDDQGQNVAPGTYLVRGVFTEGDPPDVQTLETEPSTLSISR